MEVGNVFKSERDAKSAEQFSDASGLLETDYKLLVRVEQKSRAALEILYDRHSAYAMGIAAQVLVDRDLAEGVILEAYWWLWNNASRTQFENVNFSVWFYNFVRVMALREQQKLLKTSRDQTR